MKNYETEARERWGNTDAYREHEQKTKNYTKEKWAEASDGGDNRGYYGKAESQSARDGQI